MTILRPNPASAPLKIPFAVKNPLLPPSGPAPRETVPIPPRSCPPTLRTHRRPNSSSGSIKNHVNHVNHVQNRSSPCLRVSARASGPKFYALTEGRAQNFVGAALPPPPSPPFGMAARVGRQAAGRSKWLGGCAEVSRGGTSSKAVPRVASPHSKTLARGSGVPRAAPGGGRWRTGPSTKSHLHRRRPAISEAAPPNPARAFFIPPRNLAARRSSGQPGGLLEISPAYHAG